MTKSNEQLNKRMAAIMAAPASASPLPKSGRYGNGSVENRAGHRSPSYKICQVQVADGSKVKCVMRNISAEGALLTGDGAGGMPQVATLEIPDTRELKNFEVMWREKDQVGIKFLN